MTAVPPPPSRPIVTSPADLDALPPGAVIRDADAEVFQKGWGRTPYSLHSTGWWATGDEDDYREVVFPADVLFEGAPECPRCGLPLEGHDEAFYGAACRLQVHIDEFAAASGVPRLLERFVTWSARRLPRR